MVHYMTLTLFVLKQYMRGKQEKKGYLTFVLTPFFEKNWTKYDTKILVMNAQPAV